MNGKVPHVYRKAMRAYALLHALLPLLLAAQPGTPDLTMVFVRDEAEDFDTLARQGRHVVMDGPLAGQLTVLATELLRLAREDRRTRDLTRNSLRLALSEIIAAFPVLPADSTRRPRTA